MKEDICEYYPNGRIKSCLYYDLHGRYHNINAPACQYWYDNGYKSYETYIINGESHNIYNPSRIGHTQFGKIMWKSYYINSAYFKNKLNWLNYIKNI